MSTFALILASSSLASRCQEVHEMRDIEQPVSDYPQLRHEQSAIYRWGNSEAEPKTGKESALRLARDLSGGALGHCEIDMTRCHGGCGLPVNWR